VTWKGAAVYLSKRCCQIYLSEMGISIKILPKPEQSQLQTYTVWHTFMWWNLDFHCKCSNNVVFTEKEWIGSAFLPYIPWCSVFPPRLDTYQTSAFCFDCVLRTLSRNVKLALLTGQETFLCCGMKAVWIC